MTRKLACAWVVVAACGGSPGSSTDAGSPSSSGTVDGGGAALDAGEETMTPLSTS